MDTKYTVAGILKCTSTVSLAHFPSLALPILSSSFLSLAYRPELKRQMRLSNIVHDSVICDKWAEGVSRHVQLNSDANVMIAKTKLDEGQVVLQVGKMLSHTSHRVHFPISRLFHHSLPILLQYGGVFVPGNEVDVTLPLGGGF
jgi:hypothetical protein